MMGPGFRAAMQRVVAPDFARETRRALDILMTSAPPDGKCWGCQQCGHYAISGGAAANHVTASGHALPELEPIPTIPGDPKGLANIAELGIDLRLAVEIGQTLFGMLERSRLDVRERTCAATTTMKNQLDEIEQRIKLGDA